MTVTSPTGSPRLPARAVLLPGTGSDADFVVRAFGSALSTAGIELVAVDPYPADVVAGYLAALDEAAETPGELLVGGISLGAAVAARWALHHQQRLTGMLIALPAWIGSPEGAPASSSARHSAERLRQLGLAAVLAEVRRSSPAWLSAELSRAWQHQWPDLPQSLDDAAAQPGPTEQELANLRVPTGVVGAVDDAVHPLTVAQQWAGASPAAALATVRLDELGANPGVLGAACVRSWRKASKRLSAG
jgi:pimeloyl-ACP methyl ester carboxylesterase